MGFKNFLFLFFITSVIHFSFLPQEVKMNMDINNTFHFASTVAGKPAEVVVTPYKTTLLADGKDVAVIDISIIDKEGHEVPNADNLIQLHLEGDAKILSVSNENKHKQMPNTIYDGVWQVAAFHGRCQVILQSGIRPGFIKFKASAKGLWEGGTDIITIRPNQAVLTQNDSYIFSKLHLKSTAKLEGKILGADISYLPELEANGIRFSDKGNERDVLEILKNHGFNFIRLRLFVSPDNDSGYSPGKGFCNLEQTLKMAKRIKGAGMKFLLDFHYSDTWADPGKQYKPQSWRALNMDALSKTVFDYTYEVLEKLKAQGTLPDMVQTGNEINHGILWPEGSVQHLNNLATLLNAGMAAVKKIDPAIVTLLHLALGGQNEESENFINYMQARQVNFDVIGLSYYPKWHGTLVDLKRNINILYRKYQKPVIVAEYSQVKKEVNQIAFSMAGSQMKGTFIWEPLSTWESIFNKDGNANKFLYYYDEIAQKFLSKNK